MSVTFVQGRGGRASSATSVSITPSTNPASGNHLIAAFGAWRANATMGTSLATAGYGTWVNASVDTWNYQGSNWLGFRIDYAENIPGGAVTVTVHTIFACELSGYVMESSGAATTSSLGGATTPARITPASATAQPGSLTFTSGSLGLIFITDDSGNTAQCTFNNSFTADPAGGTGTIWDGSIERTGAGYRSNMPAGAMNPTITESSGTALWIVGMIEVLASGGAATKAPPPFIQRHHYNYIRRR